MRKLTDNEVKEVSGGWKLFTAEALIAWFDRNPDLYPDYHAWKNENPDRHARWVDQLTK